MSRLPSRLQRGKNQSRPADRPSASISPARIAAFEVLTRVVARKGHSDDLLHSHLTAHLSPEDRNLATALVMGVLRWQIALDAQTASLLSRPGQKTPEAVAVALRLGAFQLLHMDRIPAHAALNESVELCRMGGQPQAAGMVNAVLRKLSRLTRPSAKVYETPAKIAERLAHPQWLVDRWAATYGRDAALAICEYDQHEPPERTLFIADSSQPGAEHLPQIDDGSRLVAEIAAAAVPNGSAESHIWDCCAAPGGKTLVLAARVPSAEILATDVSSRRLTQMQRRLQSSAYADHVRTEVLDASSDVAEISSLFDLILCDVPCSGTGTLARNPEIRLRLSPDELPLQSARQRAILRHALQRLAPGGRLVYSTCSLEPEENEQVLQTVLAETRCEQVPIEPLLLHLASSGLLSQESADMLLRTAVRDGALRSLPGVHPFDGFYVVILERNKAS